MIIVYRLLKLLLIPSLAPLWLLASSWREKERLAVWGCRSVAILFGGFPLRVAEYCWHSSLNIYIYIYIYCLQAQPVVHSVAGNMQH